MNDKFNKMNIKPEQLNLDIFNIVNIDDALNLEKEKKGTFWDEFISKLEK